MPPLVLRPQRGMEELGDDTRSVATEPYPVVRPKRARSCAPSLVPASAWSRTSAAQPPSRPAVEHRGDSCTLCDECLLPGEKLYGSCRQHDDCGHANRRRLYACRDKKVPL
jgi:hypothetical protein